VLDRMKDPDSGQRERERREYARVVEQVHARGDRGSTSKNSPSRLREALAPEHPQKPKKKKEGEDRRRAAREERQFPDRAGDDRQGEHGKRVGREEEQECREHEP